jgi:hypothetical protein
LIALVIGHTPTLEARAAGRKSFRATHDIWYVRENADMRKAAQEFWEIVKAWWLFVTGVALGVVAIVQEIEGASHMTVWFWAFCAMTALWLATLWRLRGVIKERDQSLAANEVFIGPSPFPRTKLERAVVKSLMVFEEIERERAVQGNSGLFDRLMRCAGEVDVQLREVDAGDLYTRFREDGLHPPHDVNEQVAYLRRQIDLFESVLRQLRIDGG